MLEVAPQAASMKDLEGFLPIHTACKHHCSTTKLRLLLKANPESLNAKTKQGDTPLDLAIKTVTEEKPNEALIAHLKKENAQASADIEGAGNRPKKARLTEH